MAGERIRLGFIGAGAIGSVHMKGFSTFPEFELAGVTDAFVPLAEKRAQEYSIPKVYATADEMIADERIDAVVIGVPNKYHAPLAIQAMKAGKNVLLEKPMGINGAAAKDIVRTQRATGKLLMVSHQTRWDSLRLQVKEAIDRGDLGQIYFAKTGWFRRKGIPGWGSWFTRMDESGGGPLIDIGVHMIDATLWLMGNPKPVSVFGSTYAEFGPKKRGLGAWGTPNWDGYYDVEDLASALIKLDNGATLTLDVSWAVHMHTDSQPFIHLMGADGGAFINNQGGKLLTEAFQRPIEVDLKRPDNDEGDRARMIRHFLACIRGEEEPLTSAMTGLANNLILDAIYESSRTGREVVIDWTI